MFDIGFSELMLIAVVALIVLGPERLPKVARTAGHLLGRLQRYVSDVKADINREMQLEDLRKMRQEMESSARDFETSVNKQLIDVEGDLNRSLAADAPSDTSLPAPAGESTAPLDETLTEPPSQPETLPASEPSPQLELGLDAVPHATPGGSGR